MQIGDDIVDSALRRLHDLGNHVVPRLMQVCERAMVQRMDGRCSIPTIPPFYCRKRCDSSKTLANFWLISYRVLRTIHRNTQRAATTTESKDLNVILDRIENDALETLTLCSTLNLSAKL